jgi:hypothetical protein
MDEPLGELMNAGQSSYSVNGMAVTDSGGLVATLGKGTGSGGRLGSMVLEDVPVTLTASKDTYLAWDMMGGAVVQHEVAVGAAAPTIPAWQIAVAKATTDAGDITALTDLRNTAPIKAEQIAPLAVIEAKLGALSVTEGKIGALAVTTAKIGNLAVEEGKIGALAVTNGKIGALAVDEGKIAALAVTNGKIGALAVDEGKIAALAVTSGKLGADSVIAGKIADGAVDVSATLANGIVVEAKIGTGAVTAGKVASQVIDDDHVYQRRKVALNPNPNFMRSRS